MTSLSALFEEFKASRLKYPQQRRGAEDAFFGGLVDAIGEIEARNKPPLPARYPAGNPAGMLDYPAPRVYPEGARQGIVTTNPAAALVQQSTMQGIMQDPKRRGRPPKVRDDAPPAAPVTEEPNG